MSTQCIADTESYHRARIMTAPEIADLLCSHQKLEQEVVVLRHQVAWFQRQLFGQKSEK